jgi:adenylate cyclase class 2
MAAGANHEIEIKLRVPDAAAARRLLRRAGFRVVKRRVWETNVLFDNPARDLRARSCLIRIRRAGARAILTYKGAPEPGRHKSREELEAPLARPETFEAILERLGFEPVFRYEKYRTEYRRGSEEGLVTLDQTPIGVFLELEGGPDWIDRLAGELGFAQRHFILASYATLYVDYCRERGLTPRHMVFAPGESRQVTDKSGQ